MPADLPSLERLLRLRGPLGLAEIAGALGCSTKTVQRLVAAADERISPAFRELCRANAAALERAMSLA